MAGGAEVTVDVRNTGRLAGDEVVQLYVRAPESAKDRRVHHLEGFARVTLAKGETRSVKFRLTDYQLSVFGEDGKPSLPKGATTGFAGGGQPGFSEVVRGEVEL